MPLRISSELTVTVSGFPEVGESMFGSACEVTQGANRGISVLE